MIASEYSNLPASPSAKSAWTGFSSTKLILCGSHRESTLVRPDVSVLCHGLAKKYIDYTPALVAQVLSPSTQDKDCTPKKQLYQQQGVRWYLIIDAEKKAIEFLELDRHQFVERLTSDHQIRLSLNGDCQI